MRKVVTFRRSGLQRHKRIEFAHRIHYIGCYRALRCVGRAHRQRIVRFGEYSRNDGRTGNRVVTQWRGVAIVLPLYELITRICNSLQRGSCVVIVVATAVYRTHRRTIRLCRDGIFLLLEVGGDGGRSFHLVCQRIIVYLVGATAHHPI